MITALLLSVFLFLSAVASHLAILGVGHRLLDRRRDTQAKLAVSLLVLASHFLVAILFAAGFWLGAQWGLGGFDKAPSMAASGSTVPFSSRAGLKTISRRTCSKH